LLTVLLLTTVVDGGVVGTLAIGAATGSGIRTSAAKAMPIQTAPLQRLLRSGVVPSEGLRALKYKNKNTELTRAADSE